jgi:hypothetical protein
MRGVHERLPKKYGGLCVMNDNDVIKALECCAYYITPNECEWSNCPFVTEKGCSLELDELQKLALDLIKRQKAEIERLQKQLKEGIDLSDDVFKIVKAEARKEFTERLKEIAQPYGHVEFYPNGKTLGVIRTEQYLLKENDIDNLLEEMESERE